MPTIQHFPHINAGLNATSALLLIIGFGVLYSLLREARPPHGAAVILEFSKPVLPVFDQIFDFYFRAILPCLGGVISGDSTAYQYLPDSVRRFPDQEQVLELLRRAEFAETGYKNLSGGIAALHWGFAEKFLS